MGVIYSVVAISAVCFKKSRDKKKAKNNPEDNIEQYPPPYTPLQSATVEGLRDEHLSSVPPPAFASQPETGGIIAQGDRNAGVSAPASLPAA